MSQSLNALRPTQDPAQRFGNATNALTGRQLPSYALRMPNRLMPAPPPVPALERIQHPPEGVRSAYGSEHEVSTRIPTGLKANVGDPHARSDLRIGMAAWQPNLDDPEAAKEVAQKYHEAWQSSIRQHYPHINTTGMSHNEAAEAYIGHLHDNIVHLWNEVRDRPWLHDAVNWYRGANNYAKALSDRYSSHVAGGLSHRQAAAAIAALSPQTDWNQNVNRVERMLNIMRDQKETAFSPEMHRFVETQMMRRKNDKARQRGLDELAQLPVGTKFKAVEDPKLQAFFARAFDELHNTDRSYPIISPTGERFAHPPLPGTGAPPRLGWGSFDELENAFQALKSDDLKNISRSLGMKHKVRSFYNNIISPDSEHGHVTIDTHAINAAQMMPMGSKHLYVTHGLGSGIPQSGITGVNGLYALYADAYRRAAATISRMEGRRYLPREVQSVAWEAVKGLFDQAEHKAMHPEFLDRGKTVPNPEHGEPAHDVGKMAKHGWNLARYGIVSPAQARAMIQAVAGGIADPQWYQFRQAGMRPMAA